MQRFILFFIFFWSFNVFSQSYLDFYFKSKGVDGSILIYDQKKDSWIFNIESDVKKNTPIGSFFNLPSALIALDLGVITNEPQKYMAWDGVKRYHFGVPKPNWNCNTNLDEALLFKNDWYFQNVSNLVRNKNYAFFLKDLDVTNLDYNIKENYYWHFGNLLSTPEKQLNFLKKLKKQEFPLDKKNQKYLYDQLLLVNNKKYTIHAYETFNVYKGERIDWMVGVLETKENIYYFSTRIMEDVNNPLTPNFFNLKMLITIEIFKLLEYI